MAGVEMAGHARDNTDDTECAENTEYSAKHHNIFFGVFSGFGVSVVNGFIVKMRSYERMTRINDDGL